MPEKPAVVAVNAAAPPTQLVDLTMSSEPLAPRNTYVAPVEMNWLYRSASSRDDRAEVCGATIGEHDVGFPESVNGAGAGAS